MQDVRLFENAAYGQVRVIMREGEPWFVAADVCRVLEIQNVPQAVALLDEDEVDLCNVYAQRTGRGGAHSMNLISESGLYSLIFRSRKNEAKAFRRWVTHEVLPTLRRNGAYAMGAAPDDPQGMAALILALQREQQETKRLRKQLAWKNSTGAKRLMSAPAAEEDDRLPEQCVSAFLTALQKMMAAGQVQGRVINQRLCVTPAACAQVEEQLREEGNELPVTRNRLYQSLKAMGVVESGQDSTTQVKYMDGRAVRVLVIPLDKIKR